MYQRILVPFDGSSASQLGLDEAIKLAKLSGAKLRVIHVIDELVGAVAFEAFQIYAADVLVGMRKIGHRILRDAKDQAEAADLEVETELFEGMGHGIVGRVVEEARSWPADLIVIGSHGRRGAARALMGSDAESVMRQSPVPVLIVRQPSDAETRHKDAPAAAHA